MKFAVWALPEVDVILVVLQKEVLAIVTNSIFLCLFWLVIFVCSLREPVLD